MKQFGFIFLFFLGFSFGFSQVKNAEFEKWPVLEKAINITGMDLSPDGKTLALACARNQGLLLYNLETRSISKEIKLNAEYLGYSVFYSAKGNYLLLQEKRIETNFKKSKQADYYIIEVVSGKMIHQFNRVSDVKITADENQVIVLDKAEVTIRDLHSGKTAKRVEIEDACNAIALHPHGKEFAVVFKPGKHQVAQVPSVRNSKKAIKANVKTRHMLAIYDLETLQEKAIVAELYDNINLLQYSETGEKLLGFNVATNSYINVVNTDGYEPTREAYFGKTSLQPDFEYNQTESYFGIATVDTYPALNIYQVNSGKMEGSFNTKMRNWQNMKKKIYAGRIRVSPFCLVKTKSLLASETA